LQIILKTKLLNRKDQLRWILCWYWSNKNTIHIGLETIKNSAVGANKSVRVKDKITGRKQNLRKIKEIRTKINWKSE